MDQSPTKKCQKEFFPKINFSVNTHYNPTECVGEYKEFIGVYKNRLPQANCDKIIETFNRSMRPFYEDKQFSEGSAGRFDTAFDLNLLMFDDEEQQIHIVREFLNQAFAEYGTVFSGAQVPQWYTTLKMQKTPPGGGYHVWHCENNGAESANRCLVWIMYLNDVHEGGETEFLYQSQRIQPTAGTIVVWPAGFTHMHRGNPPLSEDKYILTGWTYFHPDT